MEGCKCDLLKVILTWFLQELLKSFGLSVSGEHLSKLHYLYKSNVFRILNPDSLTCVLCQETLILVGEWLGASLSKNVSRSSQRESVKGLVSNLQSQLSLPHNLTSVSDDMGSLRFSVDMKEASGSIIKYLVEDIPACQRYRCHSTKYQVEIVINCRTGAEHTWNEYRKTLVAHAVSKTLKLTGHLIDNSNHIAVSGVNYNNIIIVGKEISEEQVNSESKDVVGDPEVVLKEVIGETTAVSNSISGLLNKRLSKIGESRNSDPMLPSWVHSAEYLAKATLNFDILFKALDASIHLSGFEIQNEVHNGVFIMYNYARSLSIVRRFNEQVEKSVYPSLPELNSIKFNGLGMKMEEIQLLQLLFEWPRILDTTINFIRFETALFLIPKFVLSLARAFNAFYFEVVVLVPPTAPHNFDTMFARVYLVKAISNVFKDCLDIMQLGHIA